ncbi:MAG: endonuclease III domain-containing protein [Planctomycetota bacterium]|jgi:endonuclease-3 related protein
MVTQQLMEIYQLLYDRFGPQHWWPGQTKFEIITGAILTQNTSWTNVEKAIANLRAARLLEPRKINDLQTPQLAELIRPAGYFNIKAKRLKNFVSWLFDNYHGSLDALSNVPTERLRIELLSIKGVGRETADSILLYALDRPVFVIDAYTARVTVRHHLAEPHPDYEQLQQLFQYGLQEDLKLFNEYHALLVALGKQFCKTKPLCSGCPLEHLPYTIEFECS